MRIRRLGVGDEDVVALLADRPPRTELLRDERTLFLVAWDDRAEPIGFVLAYELPRRHGNARSLLVYEIDVAEAFRRRGVATALMRELERLARERGVEEGWVLTERENEPAMRLYRSLGGTSTDVVQWDFEYAVR